MSKQDTSNKGKTKADLQAVCEGLGLPTTGTKAELAARIEEHQTAPYSMSRHLRPYRAKYEPSKSAAGNASAHNGDDVATLLAGNEPATVVRAAELVLGLPKGELATKYEALNPGQQRMNAGNRIRAAVKRGEATTEDVAKAIAKA